MHENDIGFLAPEYKQILGKLYYRSAKAVGHHPWGRLTICEEGLLWNILVTLYDQPANQC